MTDLSTSPLSLTQDLIRCPSITPVDEGALGVLQAALEGLGFVCKRYPFEDVDNLYARLGTAEPNFCFAGHTDVVPVGDAAAWSVDPFAGEIRDGKLIARGAYYAAVVRPSFGEMAPFTVFNDDRDELELGNPNLDPYEADNFDLSLEYYPTELSVLSVGVFYKTIENAIYEATFEREEDVNGDLVALSEFLPTVPVDLSYLTADQLADVEEVTSFINVGSSDLYGIEFNYVQSLADLNPMLDGFLVSANLTLTDSESTLPDGRDVPFLKQSDTVWNLAIGYDKGPWDLRVSANYRGDYIDELTEEDLDRYTDDRLLVEASAKYRVNDNIQLYLEGKNLTDEPEYYYFGSERRLSQYDEFGTTVVFGARLTY